MNATDEIEQGKRFSFGENWASFLTTLDESRIAIATQSLRDLLQMESLVDPLHSTPKSFLDIGCGSGLFSLAARRLGACVHSFDFDPQSVACALELRNRFDSAPAEWTIEQGSALDQAYLEGLGTFDVVYSWGVLHHTGDLWQALLNAADRVKPGGSLVVAIYNDQGWRSRMWLRVKQIYCAGPAGAALIKAIFLPWFFLRTILVSLIRGQNEFRAYRRHRGMSIVHDWIDWLGGLPFEVASFQAVEEFFTRRGYRLINSVRTSRLGCNQFCFRRED